MVASPVKVNLVGVFQVIPIPSLEVGLRCKPKVALILMSSDSSLYWPTAGRFSLIRP